MEEIIDYNCYENTDTPFFSVIVPTYNVEEYIVECIESVLNQSFDNWELILIDDGSIDSTASICESYSANNNRIIFKQNNHGMQAKARNTGIKLAKGRYICFLDSDDYWGLEHLKNLRKCIADAKYPDMCIANQHTNVYEDKTIKMVLFSMDKQIKHDGQVYDETLSNGSNRLISAIEIKELIFSKDSKVPGATVLNTYKHSFLIDNDISFNEALSLSEDLDFFLQGISLASSLCMYDNEYYYYRQTNPNSTIHTINTNKLYDRLNVCKKWYDYFGEMLVKEEDNNSPKWMREMQYKLAVQVRETFNDAANISKVKDDLFVSFAKKSQYIIKREKLGSYFSEYILTRVNHIIMYYYWMIFDILKVIVHKWREYHD